MNPVNKKQLCDLVKKSSDPLILIPENFDIDAVSGAVGLYLFLENNKKKPRIACSVDLPENLLFLSGKKIFERNIQGECIYKLSFVLGESRIKELSYEQEGSILKISLATSGGDFRLEKPRVEPLKFNHDLVFVIGSPDLRSLGKIYSDNVCFFSEITVINIDSHAKNEKFGNVNLIRRDSPVSELVAEMANMISRETMDSRTADLFLTGIIAKTNNFQAEKIKAETFALASILLRTGANREEVMKWLITINLLASEKTEFYPSSKITKQIIDKINKKSPWYPQQEKGKFKQLDGLKMLALNQKAFYLAAILSTIPCLMILERANIAVAPALKKSGSVFLQKNLTDAGEKKALSYKPIFLSEVESVFPVLNEAKQEPPQNGTIEQFAGLQEKSITTTLKIVTDDNLPNNSLLSAKNNIIKNKPEIKPEEVGIPKSFSIPLLAIHTNVQPVGLITGGEMGTPNNFKDVAWFNLGVRPGEAGNAVLAGHLDTNLGKGGVFWNLNKVQPGNYVFVYDKNNKKMRFRVVRSEVYGADNAPMEEIFGSSDEARLNLITCDGAWDRENKNYNERLVVYTEYDPE